MKTRELPSVEGVIRIAVVAAVIILQLSLVYILVRWLQDGAFIIYFTIEFAAVITILIMVSRNRNSSYTIAWIMIITFLPLFGFLLYVLWGRSGAHSPRNRRFNVAMARGNEYLEKDPQVYADLGRDYPAHKRTGGYLGRKGFPLYRNTDIKYYALGEYQFDAMLEEIKSAKRFVFIEFFILSEGKLWQRFEPVLAQKAAEGVEVRILYDDFGSIVTLQNGFIRRMEAKGIRVARFNPIHKHMSRLYINYRNHQKIVVIDGNVAYTGGTNMADEYANLYPKHGHWKDTAIRLSGDAVWSLTVTFLQMWDGETGDYSDYERYRAELGLKKKGTGYVQPFSDGPLNNPDNPAEFMYRNIIANAKDYVYITTPYLVIDNSILDALIGAAESGVDVRIITPKVWDHWYVHAVTRSNYKEILKAGGRIYEYTPGYIHAKTILSDDSHAVTGSINMDYRSFNLHFENGVWMCGCDVLKDIKQDILDTFDLSEEIMLDEYLRRPVYLRLLEGVLRIFAVVL